MLTYRLLHTSYKDTQGQQCGSCAQMPWMNTDMLFSAMLASAGLTVVPSCSINILGAEGLVPMTAKEDWS